MDGVYLPGVVLDGRLRSAAKIMGCSVSEALGIIATVMLFAGSNADEKGFIDVRIADLWHAVAPNVGEGITEKLVCKALLETGYVSEFGDSICIVSWERTQKPLYDIEKFEQKLAKRRMEDAARKRAKRTAEKSIALDGPESTSSCDAPEDAENDPADSVNKAAENVNACAEKATADPDAVIEKAESVIAKSQEESEASKKPAKPKPQKIRFAEYVHMTKEQYDKLVVEFGKEATAEMIRVLDNYKGAKGKAYKNDYRAILSWAVDAVKEKRPNIFASSKKDEQWHDENPFKQGG